MKQVCVIVGGVRGQILNGGGAKWVVASTPSKDLKVKQFCTSVVVSVCPLSSLFCCLQRARKENAKIREQLEKQKQAREREVQNNTSFSLEHLQIDGVGGKFSQ